MEANDFSYMVVFDLKWFLFNNQLDKFNNLWKTLSSAEQDAFRTQLLIFF